MIPQVPRAVLPWVPKQCGGAAGER